MDALRRNGSLSRVEIARLSGLTPQAIRNIVDDLLQTNLIRETGRRKGFRGQPQIDIEINPDGGYSLGFHVEGGILHHVAANLGGQIIYEGRSQTIPRTEPEMLAAITEIDARSRQELKGLSRLGVGAVFSRPSTSKWFLNEQNPEEFEAQSQALARYFEDEIVFENDANAAALAESVFGLARAGGDFLYLFVGEGVGGGIIEAGEAVRGVRGNAGEFGHILIDPNGEKCHCGNRGCLHGYLSIGGLRRKHPDASIEPNSVPDDWLDVAAAALGRALVSLENILDPQRVILGGTAPEWLLSEIVRRLSRQDFPSVRSELAEERIEISRLGSRSALLGAAALSLLNVTNPSLAKLTKQSFSLGDIAPTPRATDPRG